MIWCCKTRAKLSHNKVNGPEDAIVSEMIQRFVLMEKIYIAKRCFQARFLGLMEFPGSWKIVKLVFLRKTRFAAPKKGIRSYRATALTSVMFKVVGILSSVLRLEREKRA